MVGSGSDTCTVIFAQFLTQNQAKILNLEGSRQEEIGALWLRDHFDEHFDCDYGSEFNFAG